MATIESSRKFWNEKASQNAYWYISSFGPYENRDLEQFWNSGAMIWRDIQNATGFRPSSNQHVVEIGCGVGRISRAIAADVSQIDAFDISKEMVERARELKLSNANFHVGSGEGLHPAPDHSADFVLAYCVFQHLPSMELLAGYLREMVRVAKPGATIAFTLSARPWYYPAFPLLRSISWAKSHFRKGGPSGLYKKEWVGIRPTRSAVQAISPLPLKTVDLHGGDKWLLWGVVPQECKSAA